MPYSCGTAPDLVRCDVVNVTGFALADAVNASDKPSHPGGRGTSARIYEYVKVGMDIITGKRFV
jgi:hypothetical protein